MTLQTRLSTITTIPHLTALLSLVTLFLYTTLTIRTEAAQNRQAHHLANRAALVYLADDIPALRLSLKSLSRHLRLPTQYKLIILHDESLTPSTQGTLQALSETYLHFRPIPANASTPFWSATALLHDASASLFADLDYVVRLSSNATFQSTVKQDFIKAFVMQRAQYAYHKIVNQCNVSRIRDLATSYVDINGIQPRSDNLWRAIFKKDDCLPAFSGAFELFNLRFFRSHSGIQDWLRVVDSHDAVWREGVVRYLTVALYAAPGKVVTFEKLLPFRV